LTSHSGCLVLEAFSVSHGKASPYLPVIELLKSYFQLQPHDEERRRRQEVSRPWELPPRSLAEPCMNVFAHTAPLIPPPVPPPSASEQRAAALSALCVRASALLAAYGVATVCISASPTEPGSDPGGAGWDTSLTCKSARSR